MTTAFDFIVVYLSLDDGYTTLWSMGFYTFRGQSDGVRKNCSKNNSKENSEITTGKLEP